MVTPINRKKKKMAEQPSGWPLTNRQTKWKNGADHSPSTWRQSCTTALGSKVMRQPCRQEDGTQAKEEGERKRKREETRKEGETAQRQTSSCTGQARLTGRDVLFLLFSADEATAACVACAQLRGRALVQGHLWKAHTHRSGQGGCMLENSGLVLGVDSSLGLLTWLHNPRHVGVALLIHGWLLHLTKKHKAERKVSQITKVFAMTYMLKIIHITALIFVLLVLSLRMHFKLVMLVKSEWHGRINELQSNAMDNNSNVRGRL